MKRKSICVNKKKNQVFADDKEVRVKWGIREEGGVEGCGTVAMRESSSCIKS
jgi:hypothetical protein